MYDFVIRQGTTRDSLRVILKGSDGQARMLVGVADEVRFHMRRDNGRVVVDGAPAEIEEGAGGDVGQVRFDWSDPDVASSGDFQGWFEEIDLDGTTRGYPSLMGREGYISIGISPR